jgi:hypothetical protein
VYENNTDENSIIILTICSGRKTKDRARLISNQRGSLNKTLTIPPLK